MVSFFHLSISKKVSWNNIINTLLLKGCHSFQYPLRGVEKNKNWKYIQDVRAWLIAALDAERITTMVIRDTHLGAAHDVPRE